MGTTKPSHRLVCCSCDGEILLLQRTSKHNYGTWGLPGGNADAGDADLKHTATREAQEEMGADLPAFTIVAQVLTKRGKRWAPPFKLTVQFRHLLATALLPLKRASLTTHGAGSRSTTPSLLVA